MAGGDVPSCAMSVGDVLRLGPHDSLEIRSSTPEELEVLASYRPHGSPPPAHLHPDQDESFEVLEGEMRALVDGEELRLAAGAEIDIRRGQVHQMWNPAEVEARVRWKTRPALRTEEWFRTLDSLFAPDGPIARGEEVDFPALLDDYADVFRLVLDG
jgi:mannose-6-phosphate isomerase-like protein (cupin superfamily)